MAAAAAAGSATAAMGSGERRVVTAVPEGSRRFPSARVQMAPSAAAGPGPLRQAVAAAATQEAAAATAAAPTQRRRRRIVHRCVVLGSRRHRWREHRRWPCDHRGACRGGSRAIQLLLRCSGRPGGDGVCMAPTAQGGCGPLMGDISTEPDTPPPVAATRPARVFAAPATVTIYRCVETDRGTQQTGRKRKADVEAKLAGDSAARTEQLARAGRKSEAEQLTKEMERYRQKEAPYRENSQEFLGRLW